MTPYPFGDTEMRVLYALILAMAIGLRLAPSYGGQTGTALRHIALWAAIIASLALGASFFDV